jgi:hypothetical protein
MDIQTAATSTPDANAEFRRAAHLAQVRRVRESLLRCGDGDEKRRDGR